MKNSTFFFKILQVPDSFQVVCIPMSYKILIYKNPWKLIGKVEHEVKILQSITIKIIHSASAFVTLKIFFLLLT